MTVAPHTWGVHLDWGQPCSQHLYDTSVSFGPQQCHTLPSRCVQRQHRPQQYHNLWPADPTATRCWARILGALYSMPQQCSCQHAGAHLGPAAVGVACTGNSSCCGFSRGFKCCRSRYSSLLLFAPVCVCTSSPARSTCNPISQVGHNVRRLGAKRRSILAFLSQPESILLWEAGRMHPGEPRCVPQYFAWLCAIPHTSSLSPHNASAHQGRAALSAPLLQQCRNSAGNKP